MKIDQDIATNLIMGIEEGSEDFNNDGVSPITFEVFAELLRAGGQRARQAQQQNYPQGSIPGQQSGQQDKQQQTSSPPQQQRSGSSADQKPKATQQSQSGGGTGQSATGQESGQDNESDQAPKDWLEPKIYKGTSIK